MSKEESLLQKWVTEKFGGVKFLLTTYNSESMEEYARFYHAQQLESINEEKLKEEFNCIGGNYGKGIKPCVEWCGEDICQKPSDEAI